MRHRRGATSRRHFNARPASNASAKARLSAVVVTRNDQYARDQLVWSSIAEHTLGE